MAKVLYCWRCTKDVPMLEEDEWAQVLPALSNAVRQIKEYREKQGASVDDAKQHVYVTGALERYLAITGYRETNSDVLWHHRLSLFGPPCAACGKPLRTPRAKMCAACGAPKTT